MSKKAVTVMAKDAKTDFKIDDYLATTGPGRKMLSLERGQAFFVQGDSADCVFYLHKGRARISVVSSSGKEATIRLVSVGDFFGERAMAEEPAQRVTNATAMTDCTALRIARAEFIRVMHEEQSFLYQFSSFLLSCSMKTQADFVDQLFNRAEKRLARLLLLLAESAQSNNEATLILPISQETLANMIGSTRPRVNAFMNRFRKLGFIEYDDRIRVHKSLLNVFLRD
jgi:CRP/FNR family transcriptional regulator, cyclic AMP receptor protein